jgi:cytochrome oxidase Cu insertion factor (SCO1/SenC/PrrC family)
MSTSRFAMPVLRLAPAVALVLLAGPALAEDPAGHGAHQAEPAADAGKAEGKPCCHPKKGGALADADDALPTGMTGEDEAAPEAAPGPALPPAVSVSVKATPLLDQDGRAVRFDRDVVGDKLVVVDFVFTTCTTICPILSAKLARVQEKLGDRLGKEVRLISVSIDPARDTPERLKAYAARFKARAGWSWVTGEPEAVNGLLKGLGAYTADFTAHAPMMLVGDGQTGRWARLNGFPDPDRVVGVLDALKAARPAATARN